MDEQAIESEMGRACGAATARCPVCDGGGHARAACVVCQGTGRADDELVAAAAAYADATREALCADVGAWWLGDAGEP